MIIGAKILLAADSDAACEGLGRLAGDSWLLSIAGHEVRGGHPAGSALPGAQVPGQRGLVAVEFGELAAPDGACAVLPVRWESLEAGDSFTVLLDADMTVAPVTGQSSAVLTLAGVCRLAGTLNAGSHEQNRALVTAAARTFITSVADAVTRDAVTRGSMTRATTSGRSRSTALPALSWLSELPGTLRIRAWLRAFPQQPGEHLGLAYVNRFGGRQQRDRSAGRHVPDLVKGLSRA